MIPPWYLHDRQVLVSKCARGTGYAMPETLSDLHNHGMDKQVDGTAEKTGGENTLNFCALRSCTTVFQTD
eukprot:4544499-Amphidinium_carterae.1